MADASLFDDSRILILDDRLENLMWLSRLLEWAGYRHVKAFADPEEAIAQFGEVDPDLVILDLFMPRISGFEVLGHIRRQARPDDYLPVLIFTNADDSKTRNQALEGGANDFLTKPGDSTEILLRVKNFLEARRMHRRLHNQNQELEVRVADRTQELEEARFEALEHLARVSEFHDDETGEHTQRVGMLSASIAEALRLPDYEVELIRLAAPLHDIGKIGISQSILRKPGKLTPDERRAMEQHTVIGSKILGKSRSPILQLAGSIALYHHERWDGGGYSSGLKKDSIPISARIVAAADVYDALTHERPYKAAWPRERAVEEIVRSSGTQFDPKVVEAFLAVIQSGRVGAR